MLLSKMLSQAFLTVRRTCHRLGLFLQVFGRKFLYGHIAIPLWCMSHFLLVSL